jgi:hypothetical protein
MAQSEYFKTTVELNSFNKLKVRPRGHSRKGTARIQDVAAWRFKVGQGGHSKYGKGEKLPKTVDHDDFKIAN